ncbi:MAG: hypothetical protein IKZ88_07600 [Neisseriaceae bacterium]|nr:hypothetical protein [Neisseriaceae bacterium]
MGNLLPTRFCKVVEWAFLPTVTDEMISGSLNYKQQRLSALFGGLKTHPTVAFPHLPIFLSI